MSLRVPEKYRVKNGPMGSDSSYGNNGLFIVPSRNGKVKYKVIASDGAGWDHVSVSIKNRIPKWSEMEYIKRLFWDKEDTVIQFHPPESEYINVCKFCLHMWRRQDDSIKLPPAWMVA